MPGARGNPPSPRVCVRVCCAQADKQFLVNLKSAQEQARLMDDEASAVVKEAARAKVEGLLDKALECVKRRTRVRDYTDAVTSMRQVRQQPAAGAALAPCLALRLALEAVRAPKTICAARAGDRVQPRHGGARGRPSSGRRRGRHVRARRPVGAG